MAFTSPEACQEEACCEDSPEDSALCNDLAMATSSSNASTGSVSLTYATYFGTSINNGFNDVLVDDSGNSFAFGTTINQGFDAVLVKFDPAGAVVWQQYLGGNDAENFNSNENKDYGRLALDGAGNIYVTGITQSNNFPTMNPFQGTKSGGIDAFVAKYDTDGNLLFSSYLGGAGDENIDGSGGIAVDQNGNIFIAGSTTASGFFNSSVGAQTNFSGGTVTDIFIVKITSDFSTVTGTYWGDEEADVVRDLVVSADGTVWAAGYSENSGLALSGEQTNAQGDKDGVLIGWNNDLGSIHAGTFFGGQFDDEINALATDANNNIFITGSTFSTTDFPTQNGFQNSYIGGQEAFAAKLNSSAQITWSSFLGGGQNELGLSIDVDETANVYVGGTTSSFDFPVARTVQATYNSLNCEYDAFIFKFNADGTRDWSSFYGGWRLENPNGIAVNSKDQVIVVGETESTDLPITPDAHLTTPPVTGVNAFLSIFEVACPAVPIIIHSTENAIFYEQFWCSSYESFSRPHFSEDSCAVFLIAPPGYNNYSWKKNGNTVSGATGQYYTIPDPGSSGAQYELEVQGGHGCPDLSSSTPIDVDWVRPMCGFGSLDPNELPHLANITEGYLAEIYCAGDNINYSLSADGFCGAEFQWQKDFTDIPDANAANYTVTSPGCYRIGVYNNFTGCTVYSETKKFLTLDSVKLNDYNVNECIAMDTIVGCASVRIRGRVPHCSGCYISSSNLTYTFFHEGNQVAQNSYGWHNTAIPGDYTVEVSNGSCTIGSNNLHVKIQPTEPPVWITPYSSSVCIFNAGPTAYEITHPSANDSATIRFDFPYPTADIIGLDSIVIVDSLNSGCMNVKITTKNGCTSRSESIKLQDTLTPKIIPYGPTCIPVRLRSSISSSCEMDSMLWYFGDSLLRATTYATSHTATEAGPYILRIKNACGEFTSDTIFLQGSIAVPAITPTGPVCLPANLEVTLPVPDSHIIVHWYVQSTPSGCNTNINNLISNQNGTTLIANAPGYYFATIEDTLSGCISNCTDKVEVQRSVAGASISPANNIYFCDGSNITNVNLTVTPASSSFTYQWYRNSNPITGAISSSYTANMPGVYRVFLENSCDNSFTPAVSIYNIDNPTLTINEADTVYLCGPDTIRLSTTSDQPLVYQWYKDGIAIADEIDSIYLATAIGIYEVRGINNNTQCEDYSQQINVLRSSTITANLTAVPACVTPCSGSIQTIIGGGIPFSNGGYLYSWSNNENNASITNLCLGDYFLTVTDAAGCTATFTTEIDAGFSIATAIDSISCWGQMDGRISTSIIGGKPPFIYEWNTTAANTPTIDSLGPGNYQLTVTDSLGCTELTNIDLIDPVDLSMVLNAEAIGCQGMMDGKINGTFDGGHPPYNFAWSEPVILDSMMLSAGVYVLTLTDQNACAIIDSIEVFAPDALEVVINITNELDCPGDSDGVLETVVSGGTGLYTYTWENAAVTPDRSGLLAGNYTVTVSDEQNCSATATATLAGTTVLTISNLQVQHTTCAAINDGTISFVGGGGLPPYAYLVNGANSGSNQSENLSPGNYSLQLMDANNCTSAIIDTVITAPLPITLQLTSDSISCQGASDGVIYAAYSGGTPPYQLNWDKPVTLDDHSLSPGWYHLTLTDSNNCQVSDSIQLSEPDLLSGNIVITQSLLCNGAENGSLSANVIGGVAPYVYHWKHDASVADLNNLSAGIYELTVTDANNCTFTESVELEEPSALNWFVIETPVSCFESGNGILNFDVEGGTSPYQYLVNGGSSNLPLFENLSAGEYSVQVIDGNNCSSLIETALIATPEALNTTIITDPVDCFGANTGAASLKVTGGIGAYNYNWENGLSGSEEENLAAGNYAITISDENDCQLAINLEVESPAPLETDFEIIDNKCAEESQGQIVLGNTIGGTAPYDLYLDDVRLGSGADAFIGLPTGDYQLTTVDDHGCELYQEVVVSEPEKMIANLGDDVEIFFGEENSLYLDVLNPGAGIQVTWFPMDYLECEETLDGNCYTPSIVLPKYNINYFVEVTDENGCTATDDIQVRVRRKAQPIYLGNTFSPNGDGVNDIFYVQSHPSVETISKFQIFNRWGGLVFSAENFTPNNMDYGWDGRQDGSNVGVGVFIYSVEYVLLDGKKGATKGDVLVIR